MGTLNITEIKKDEAERLVNMDISLKLDGCLIYYIDGKLHSPRCERTERFKHIAKILKQANFPNCMGEIFVDKPNSNVFDVSRRENWGIVKFMPFDLIDSKNNPKIYEMSLEDKQILMLKEVMKVNNPFIVNMIRFKTFKDGWDYVVANDSEGLVLRNEKNWFKCKLLKEEKIEIIEHQVGKDKGTFILENGSKVSGTSVQYVEQFVGIKERGNKAIGEIEYPFLTKEGKMFQPRLRLIREEIIK